MFHLVRGIYYLLHQAEECGGLDRKREKALQNLYRLLWAMSWEKKDFEIWSYVKTEHIQVYGDHELMLF